MIIGLCQDGDVRFDVASNLEQRAQGRARLEPRFSSYVDEADAGVSVNGSVEVWVTDAVAAATEVSGDENAKALADKELAEHSCVNLPVAFEIR